MSRPWISGRAWTPDRGAVWDDGRPLDLDPDGWVRSLQEDQIARTTMLWGPLAYRPPGRYVVLYDGQGELNYTAGAQLVSSSPGRDVIEVSSDTGIELDILATNPNDYLRNIRVIMPGGIYASDPYTTIYEPDPTRDDYLSFEEHHHDIVFHPDFLDSLRGYSVVRFMNWQHTNNSTQTTWGDRPKVTDARWTINGAPLEIIIQLANQVGFDPWINLPHQADDNYITQTAHTLNQHLDPDLTPYIEYSNEVWNTTFTQHTWARQHGTDQQLDPDPYRAALTYYAQRSNTLFQIFETTYRDPNGFIAVLGSKEWDASVTQHLLNQPVAQHTDLVAIGGYFGFEANWPQNCDQIAAMDLTQFLNYIQTQSLPIALNRTTAHTTITQTHNLPLAIYEGGQHYTTNHCSGNQTKQHQIETLYDQANRHPQIKHIYTTHITNTLNAGTTLYTHYNNTSKWTPTSRFGAREHLHQTRQQAPKYDAIQTLIENGLPEPEDTPQPAG
jgi:hypothetical protein